MFIGMLSIDRTSQVPLYRQIAEVLINEIKSENLAKLQSEPELAKRFGVSRMTARQAVTELLSQGMLVRVRGRGTIVQKRRIRRPLRFDEVTSLSNDINSLGENVQSVVLDRGHVVIPDNLSAKIGVAPGTVVFRLSRVRLIDGRPLIYQVSYFPLQYQEALSIEELERHSVLQLLRDTLSVRPMRANYSVFAGFTDTQTAKALQLNVGDPILCVEKISTQQDGAWFEIADTKCVANAFELTFDVG